MQQAGRRERQGCSKREESFTHTKCPKTSLYNKKRPPLYSFPRCRSRRLAPRLERASRQLHNGRGLVLLLVPEPHRARLAQIEQALHQGWLVLQHECAQYLEVEFALEGGVSREGGG